MLILLSLFSSSTKRHPNCFTTLRITSYLHSGLQKRILDLRFGALTAVLVMVAGRPGWQRTGAVGVDEVVGAQPV